MTQSKLVDSRKMKPEYDDNFRIAKPFTLCYTLTKGRVLGRGYTADKMAEINKRKTLSARRCLTNPSLKDAG